jgi:hypothetical protein
MHTQIDWSAVTVSDLPPELAELCETVAGASSPVDAAERIVTAFGGGSLYVPALRDLRRQHLARQASALFDPRANGGKGNAGAVARRLGVSRRMVVGLLKA